MHRREPPFGGRAPAARAALVSRALAALSIALATAPAAALARAPKSPAHRLAGEARGITGPVTLRLGDGTTQVVAADGPFTLGPALPLGASWSVEVAAAPVDRDSTVSPPRGTVADRDVKLTLTCTAAALAAKPLLPAEGATNVSPLLGRVVLVLTRPMQEPPAGKLLLEARDGDAWVDTGLDAHAQYRPEGREWTFELESRLFPASRSLRVTVTPTAGKDVTGESLPHKPIRWTFATGKNPLEGKKGDEAKGGCPVEEQGKDAAKGKGARPGEPCDRP